MKVATRGKKNPFSLQKIFKNIPRSYIIWFILFLLVIGLASFSNLYSKRVISNRAAESKLQKENNKVVNEDISTLFSEVNTDESAGGVLIEPQQNTTPSSETSSSNNSQSPEQTIEVIIGMSLQVVKNHCNLGDIDAKTLRCPFIEELALRDLRKLNEAFQGTGKTFVFKMFDKPWDQIRDVSICGAATGGQTLPALSCSIKNNKMLYIAILHVSGALRSGGETSRESSIVKYTAPAKNIRKDEKDYWETPEYHFYSWETLVHEVGHKVGQNHFPTVEPKDNEVKKIGFSGSSLDSDQIFYGDLFDPGNRSEWAYELSIRCEFSVSGRCNRIYDVPNQLTIEFSESGGGEYTIYGDTYKQSAHIIVNKVLTSGEVEESGKIILERIKTLFDKHELLFIVISRGNQQYHFWLNRMDLNLKYWKGKIDIATTYRELKMVDGPGKKPKTSAYIQGSVYSNLSDSQNKFRDVGMALYKMVRPSDRSETPSMMYEEGRLFQDIKVYGGGVSNYSFPVDVTNIYGVFAVPMNNDSPVAVSVTECNGIKNNNEAMRGCFIEGGGTANFELSEKKN